MHPLLKTRRSLALYLALWITLAVLLALLIGQATGLTWNEAAQLAVPLCLLYAFVCLSPWYMCRTLPVDRTSSWRLGMNQLGAAVLACAMWIAVVRVLGAVLDFGRRLDPAIPQLVAIGLLLYILSVALHYAMLAVEASREAALETRDAELRALKSQINPHFLFNCLNSISALTASDPKRAREMCVRLSEFLRSTLGMGERESISWKEELDLARAYLEVERVRFGARLIVEMDVEEACTECKVPPLVLQPLVENAIKHGIATLVEGGTVRLRSRILAGNLEVLVENRFDPEAPAPRRSGLGLRNLRDRLETRFGNTARLSAGVDADSHFYAEMIFPCNRSSQ